MRPLAPTANLHTSSQLVNTIVIAIETQYNGIQMGYEIGYPKYDDPADVAAFISTSREDRIYWQDAMHSRRGENDATSKFIMCFKCYSEE